MKTALALTLSLQLTPGIALAQTLSREAQIASAVLAAPADRRSGARVLGWDGQGGVVTLREGTNELVCLADNPRAEPFSVACYHKDLEPFMARGRALTAAGITNDAIRDRTRWKEIDAGTLPFPREPRMLYVLEGDSVDTATGAVVQPYLRWVIYVAYATAASTGFPTRAAVGVPWLMDPGTAGAHIMIDPPRNRAQ